MDKMLLRYQDANVRDDRNVFLSQYNCMMRTIRLVLKNNDKNIESRLHELVSNNNLAFMGQYNSYIKWRASLLKQRVFAACQ